MSSESPDSSSPEESPTRPVSDPKQVEGDKAQSTGRELPGLWPIVVILILFALAYQWIKLPGSIGSRIDYSFFREQLTEKDNVASVTLNDSILSANSVLTGKWKKIPENPELVDDKDAPQLEEKFNTVVPLVEGRTLLDDLEARDVKMEARDVSVGPIQQLILYLLPFSLLMLFLIIMMRRTSDPFGSGMFGSFTRSPAKRFKPSEKHNTFDDVAGMEHAKRELQEVVEFLKNPAKFQRLGAQIPKGVLLMGPPGTGKTLLARATAGEAEVPFFSINGSEFIQMFVGVGASRVRDMFRTAKESAPAILFIDEIDAVGRMRGAGVGSGQDEREQTLNQILSEMDGFESTEAVIVIAATNRPDVLDPALLRPGRFDRHVTVEKPAKEGRVGVLKVHSRKVPLAEDVDLEKVAGGTIGFSGADLRNLVNEAALNATREGKDAVDMEDFDAARDRILMGAKREELLNEHEREMTAYHEAGHALLAWLLPDVDSVHKVTIIPRGRALGVTQLLPDEERHSVGETRLHSELAVLLGGRAAEKLVFDEYSANAEDDLKRATSLARRMVGYWGMSDVIGPVAFRHAEEHPFLGKEMHEQKQYSEETAHVIDQEMQHFLVDASGRATQILQEHRDKLDAIAQRLQEKEMVDRDELVEIIGPAVDRRIGAAKVE
ncbi:MAG: ATP-dependent zinc metalloprotease FtsH [Planctomycetaceae bacterium]|nr:ATP-dependent zinc metalloprotease FtsH [Planctomycetaceae bacterium]